MSSIKTKTIRSNLCKKGFQENRGRDHIYLSYMPEGKKTAIHTKVSHSSSEVDDSLISLMANQLKLSNNDFRCFANCTISAEKYLELVRDYL